MTTAIIIAIATIIFWRIVLPAVKEVRAEQAALMEEINAMVINLTDAELEGLVKIAPGRQAKKILKTEIAKRKLIEAAKPHI